MEWNHSCIGSTYLECCLTSCIYSCLVRFTPAPDNIDWQNPWPMLHGNGTTDYLHLKPNARGTGGTYEWIPTRERARQNAAAYYPNCEGIDSDGESIYFVSKKLKEMFELDLRGNTYTNLSTVRGLCKSSPLFHLTSSYYCLPSS